MAKENKQKKKWYKRPWVWVLIVVVIGIIGFMGGQGSGTKESSSDKTKSSSKQEIKKESTSSSSASSSSKTASSSSKKSALKFGEIANLQQDDAKIDMTIKSIKKTTPDNELVSTLKKGQGEYVIITYNISLKKGTVNPYDFTGDHLSIAGQDGAIGECQINYEDNIPESVGEGKSLDMTAIATLKTASPTANITFKDVEWTGNIAQ